MLFCVSIESDSLGYFLSEAKNNFFSSTKFQDSLEILPLLFINLEPGSFFQAHFVLP